MRSLRLFLFVFLLICSPIFATTWPAASAIEVDFVAAINQAADGDTVLAN